MKHIISVLLENEAGALSRVAGLFSARGFNIESLAVAPTDDPSLSRLTLVTKGDDTVIEQIIKQLEKLIDTISVVDLTQNSHIERELMLINITINNKNKQKITNLASAFSAKIVHKTNELYTIEMTSSSEQLTAFLAGINHKDIQCISRTGAIGISLVLN